MPPADYPESPLHRSRLRNPPITGRMIHPAYSRSPSRKLVLRYGAVGGSCRRFHRSRVGRVTRPSPATITSTSPLAGLTATISRPCEVRGCGPKYSWREALLERSSVARIGLGISELRASLEPTRPGPSRGAPRRQQDDRRHEFPSCWRHIRWPGQRLTSEEEFVMLYGMKSR